MTETLTHGYSSESTRHSLSNGYPHELVKLFSIYYCIPVHWTKFTSASEGLKQYNYRKSCLWPITTSEAASMSVRARLVDYLFPMSKVLKIRVGRSGKKKGKKKGRSTYNRVSNFFICDRNAVNAMARSTNMCT